MELSADIILLSTGVKPNTKLALDSGIEIGHGIRVTEGFETNFPDVFACGDCAEYGDGTLRQSWTDAVIDGRRAGRIAAGRLCGNISLNNPERAMSVPSMTVNTASSHVLSVGVIPKDEDSERMVLNWTDTPAYFQVNNILDADDKADSARGVFFFEDSRLAGACVTGSLKKLRCIQDAVNAGLKKDSFMAWAKERKMTP